MTRNASAIDPAAIFLPRITPNDARSVESVLAAPTLLDPGLELSGAIIEATYAASANTPVIDRLTEAGVPYLVDPQSLRFHSDTYQEIAALRSLPYAPDKPFEPSWSSDHLDDFVRGALSFQAAKGVAAYLAPGIAIRDDHEDGWRELAYRATRRAASLNGTGSLPRKPLIAFVAPGSASLRQPERVVAALADLPIDGVYVQALNLNPTRDSVEKLVRYVRFLDAANALE